MIDMLVAIAVIVVPVALAIFIIDAIHGSVAAYRTQHEELGAAGVFWDRPVSAMQEFRHVDQPAPVHPAGASRAFDDPATGPIASEPRVTPPAISGAQPHSVGQNA